MPRGSGGAMSGLAAAVALGACGYDAWLGVQCPEHELACAAAAGSGARLAPDVPFDARGPAVGDDPGVLTLTIVDATGAPTRFAELTCARPCIEVLAAISGGEPPYDVTWSDGSRAGTRRLCPSSDATYTLLVQDALRARVSAHIALTVSACAPANDAGTSEASDAVGPDACSADALYAHALSCDLSGLRDAPILRANQAYTVQLRSDLSSESTVQLQGWVGCSGAEIETLKLPVGPFAVERCIAPAAQQRSLALVAVSSLDMAIWTVAGMSARVCQSGCEP